MTLRWKIAAAALGAIGLALGPPRAGAQQPVATDLELNAMSQAMQLAFIDTGYWHSIENLDDFIATSPPAQLFNDIHDGGGTRVIDPATGRWRPDRVDLRGAPRPWQGPYISYTPSRIDRFDFWGYDTGTLIDFWGSPYYLFTPLGLARPSEGTITQEFYGDLFDQYAIISLGPDGVMSFDDAGRFFGGPPTRLAVSAVTPEAAARRDARTLRGYNFGAEQGDSRILIDGQDIGAALSWTSREIRFALPAGSQGGSLQLEVGGELSQPPLQVIVLTAVSGRWWAYE